MKHLIKGITISALMLLIFFKANSQFNETLFYDTLTKVSNEGFLSSGFRDGNFIYLSGSSFSATNQLPTVSKLDLNGNVIWTAIDNDNYDRFRGHAGYGRNSARCRGTIKSGDKIYTIVHPINQVYMLPDLPDEIWCISDSAGALLWKTNLGDKSITKIADYNDEEILVLTNKNTFDYHVIDKASGKNLFSKTNLGYTVTTYTDEADIYVDPDKNILITWLDSCRKFRDDRLTSAAWTSNIPYDGSKRYIHHVIRDSSRYIFLGLNYARAVDTATGSTVWFSPVILGFIPGKQSGGDETPISYLIKDSIVYVTWTNSFTGSTGLESAFILTAFNTGNGHVRFNVTHDLVGIPPDPANEINDAEDWPFQICMDANNQVYMTGSYDVDSGPGAESPGNWGIMKIDGLTGAKIFEATITVDSTKRFRSSQGKFIDYYNGKMYCAGNLTKRPDSLQSYPLIVSFDTSSSYVERYRKTIDCSVRFPSSLLSMQPFGAANMALLKKVGLSSVIDMRTINNKPVWNKTFSMPGKQMTAQSMKVISDTAVAASFFLSPRNTLNPLFTEKPDSIVFVKLDASGNITYRHSIAYLKTDTLSPIQIYTDPNGRVNFIFRKRNWPGYSYSGYTLNGTYDSLSAISDIQSFDPDISTVRINPVQHFGGDTMMISQTGIYSRSNATLRTTFQQRPYGYTFAGFRSLRNFAKIYSTLKLDASSYLILGRDSSNHMRADRYNFNLQNPLVWSYATPANGTTFNADSSARSVYTVSSDNNKRLVLSNVNLASGVLQWTIEKTAALYTTILPVDFRFDPVNHYFITGGYIADSSIEGIKTSYFYTTVDSSGNIIKDVVRPGFTLPGSCVNTVHVLRNGTNVYGGSINTAAWGIAGFYNSDCFGNSVVPSVSIASSSTAFCPGEPVTFKATALQEGSKPVYQWTVNGNITGGDSAVFISSTLQNNDQVKVSLTSNAGCLQTANAESNVISITISETSIPDISISGNTNVSTGDAAFISAFTSNAANLLSYQWQDSTRTHGWQATGDENATINYAPLATGDKLRCQLTSNAPCPSPKFKLSNILSFTLKSSTSAGGNEGIVYYPNPATKTLTIDSLKLTDHWLTLEIIPIDGGRALVTMNIENEQKLTINVEQYVNGIYIIRLRRKDGPPVYLRFVKQ